MKRAFLQRKCVLIGIITLLIASSVSSALALCQHNKFDVNYHNMRYCTWGCGLLGIWKQNVWDETVTYYCIDGSKERKENLNVRNGNCC